MLPEGMTADAFWAQVEVEHAKEEKFLDERGWIQCLGTYVDHNGKEYVSESWAHPITLEKYHMYTDAFDTATQDYLREKGWKSILEVEGWGKKEWNKPIQKMGRCQSPLTKRIYGFLEAQWYAVERNFDESDYPYGMSSNTIQINEMFKDFKGDEYFIWFLRTLNKDEHGDTIHVYEYWTKEEIINYKKDEMEKMTKVVLATCVSVEEARRALNLENDDVEKAITYLSCTK